MPGKLLLHAPTNSKTNMEQAIKRSRTILLKYASSLLFALLLLVTTSSVVGAAVELNVGPGNFVFVYPQGNKNKPITVYYHKPKNITEDSPVVFVMHGAKRNGREYRDTWIEHAEARQFLLLVPEFSKEHYPGSRQYNFGNTFTSWGEPFAESKWGFTAIEHIFDHVKVAIKIRTEKYSIYGHSAGGQFVHRMVLFKPKVRINTAICGNPGLYTMPVYADKFPYGLKDSGVTEKRLERAFRQKLIVLLGDRDIDEQDISLPTTPEAIAQGKHRFERGQNFYKTAKREAAKRRIPLEWDLKIVQGVGHSNEKMAKAAAELLFSFQVQKVDSSPPDWLNSVRPEELVNRTRLEAAISLAADYIKRMCNDNGKFVYLINPDPNFTAKPEYNILRHAGTIYALAMYEQRYPDEASRNALVRAAGFLKRETLAPIPGRDDLLAVWSYPELTGTSEPVQAKLGGTALGLVALLRIEKSMPGTTSIDLLRKMGRFLLFMQQNDGSFYLKYVPKHGGRVAHETSLYYPSQAALALLMLYEKDPASVWLQAAAEGIGYLASARSREPVDMIDHWALLATARLWPLYDRCKEPVPREAILQHAVRFCERILATKPQYPKDWLEYGCLTGGGWTCATATKLEGLLAALTFLPAEEGKLRQQIISTATDGISFLLRSQMRSGKYAGGIPQGIRTFPVEDEPLTEVRIDYVQHALSAMIQYRQFFYPNR